MIFCTNDYANLGWNVLLIIAAIWLMVILIKDVVKKIRNSGWMEIVTLAIAMIVTVVVSIVAVVAAFIVIYGISYGIGWLINLVFCAGAI